jgi:hypothetical protein
LNRAMARHADTQFRVLLAGYTCPMAKVMVSIPDDLLAEIDSEASRQGTSRSALLQKAAREEIGLGPADREEVLATLKRISAQLTGPMDVVAEVRRDRRRGG